MAGQNDDGPRETAAGLQQDAEDPTVRSGKAEIDKANPETQKNMIDDRSTPDEQSTRAKSQQHDKVTAENWNQ